MSAKNSFSLERVLVSAWYSDSWWLSLLMPVAWLFKLLAGNRRSRLQKQYQGKPFAVPVVVIGNISVGGSGKTPLVIALVKALAESGLQAGVVSRGYGGSADQYPLMVTEGGDASQSGDEPLLIAQQTAQLNCPVVVDPDRRRGVEYLLANNNVDLVLTDDGLQHYGLHRDIEIAVLDGARGLGNGKLLPAGPLREPIQRLSEVDFVVANGAVESAFQGLVDAEVSLQARVFRNLSDGRQVAADSWSESTAVHGVAAIGNPERFARTLEDLGLDVSLHPKDDHRPLQQADISFTDNRPVIITAKDAVKLKGAAPGNVWVLEVETVTDGQFVERLQQQLKLFIGRKS
ncbi:tetraacyldisaccharide 4'-kinase [Porticoccaceae bacterium]|nr:tetraacyldisaccharide 4'-kinase [Porticoccaceae bacterium]